jgi:hypothetical protein
MIFYVYYWSARASSSSRIYEESKNGVDIERDDHIGDKMNFTIKMSKRTIRHRTELIEKNEEDDTMYSCSLFEYDIFLCQHRTSNSAFVVVGVYHTV